MPYMEVSYNGETYRFHDQLYPDDIHSISVFYIYIYIYLGKKKHGIYNTIVNLWLILMGMICTDKIFNGIKWPYIWVNYNISRTWIVGPFGDDFQGSGGQWGPYNLPRYMEVSYDGSIPKSSNIVYQWGSQWFGVPFFFGNPHMSDIPYI